MITPFLLALLPMPQAETPSGFPGTMLSGPPKVEIAWNRLYDIDPLYAHFDRLVEAYPGYLTLEVIGKSFEGRDLRVYTLTDPSTGPASDKPAMWIDGNVHGNEVQAGEAVLYTAWYLLENKASNERAAELLADTAFYLLPSQNPDGRASWFASAHNAHSSRTGVRPDDDDGDGLEDEDSPNDLDGDGSIVMMRKHVPGEGTHRLNADDPRVMERVGRDKVGDWVILGSEGIDDDGDGRVNEDGLGGYDMNRAWPSSWQPEHVQRGAGAYPLFWPEPKAIAAFILAHPNIAGVQSFHNAGGMILRGPGAESYGSYEREDVLVYDELGKDGEKMLPFYRYMVIWKDLYTVFGGFVTWTYEGLGIISFTNELWARDRVSPDDRLGGGTADRLWFDDQLLLGAGFVDWHPYEHPLYGSIEIGGFRKDVGRVPPSFLMEEELHRNALFCIRHAAEMPKVTIEEPEITDLGDGLRAVDVVFRNEHAIPTRTALARDKHIGSPDVFTIAAAQPDASLEVLAGGFRTDRWRPESIDLQTHDPARLVRESGISSRGLVRVRWIVRGTDALRVSWQGEKGVDRTYTVD